MDLNALTIFKLSYGSHKSAEDGVCLMEAVAWMEGEPHSDHPQCACPIIGNFAMRINDKMPDEWRQKLVPFIPRLVGTRSKEHELARAEYLTWQAIRVFVPFAMDIANLSVWAAKLREFKGTLVNVHTLLIEAKAYAAANAAAAYASAAAYVADAYAANAAAAVAIWQAAINTLSGVLKIGPSGKPVSQWEARLSDYRKLRSIEVE